MKTKLLYVLLIATSSLITTSIITPEIGFLRTFIMLIALTTLYIIAKTSLSPLMNGLHEEKSWVLPLVEVSLSTLPLLIAVSNPVYVVEASVLHLLLLAVIIGARSDLIPSFNTEGDIYTKKIIDYKLIGLMVLVSGLASITVSRFDYFEVPVLAVNTILVLLVYRTWRAKPTIVEPLWKRAFNSINMTMIFLLLLPTSVNEELNVNGAVSGLVIVMTTFALGVLLEGVMSDKTRSSEDDTRYRKFIDGLILLFRVSILTAIILKPSSFVLVYALRIVSESFTFPYRAASKEYNYKYNIQNAAIATAVASVILYYIKFEDPYVYMIVVGSQVSICLNMALHIFRK